MKKKLSLSNKILIGMLLGAGAGMIAGPSIAPIQIVGDIFLRLLRMAVVPLIFSNVAVAIASMGDLRRLGSIGGKLIFIFLLTTFIAAGIGLGVAELIQPGKGLPVMEMPKAIAAEAPSFQNTVIAMFPTNIMQAFSEANMLQIIIFSIFSGVAVILMKKEDQERALGALSLLSRFIMSILRLVMEFTPYGVFALMAVTTGKFGASIFGPLGKFILTVYIGLALHAILAYGSLYFLATRKSIFSFYNKISPIWITSFSTCSSAATMPVSLRVCEEELGLKKDIVNLCIPLGATMNMDGNGVWYGAIGVFVAQAVGIDLTLTQMMTTVLVGVLMTLGAPGIPGGIFVATTIFLSTLGMPVEFVGLLAGIFRIMDMGITTVNVVGSAVVAAVIDSGDPQKNEAQPTV